MGTGDYVNRAEEIGEEPVGAVWCFDLATMDVLWKAPTGRTVLGAVAVGRGRCYAASRDGILYQFDTGSGRLLAKFDAHASLIASPALGEKTVYVISEAGTLYGLFRDGMPLAYDTDLLADNPAAIDEAPGKFVPERADGRFLVRVIPTMVAMLRSARTTKRMGKTVADRFEREVLPAWLHWIDAERERDLGTLAERELLELLERRVGHTLHEFGPESLLPGLFEGMAFASLGRRLEQLMGDEGISLAHTLTRALDGDTTFEQDVGLYEIARGEAGLEEFVARFGHRCQEEMELAQPRWREDGDFLVQTVERLSRSDGNDPRAIHAVNARKRDEAEAALPATLAKWGGACFLEAVREDLQQAQKLLPYRESGKSYLMMGYELIRRVLEELAKRWLLGRDIYFLHKGELIHFKQREQDLRNAIEERKRRWQAFRRLDVEPVIDSQRLDRLGLAPEAEDATEFSGTAVAGGRASGTARVAFDPCQTGDLGTQYVLVCPSTDPGWTPLFIDAAALVVERGGVLSHGAIVARDFGIPAVVLPNATRLIADGCQVRVDGDSARVYLLESGRPQ